jgi:hypothetical protein
VEGAELEYPNTVLSLLDGTRIDLRKRMAAGDHAALARNGLTGPCAILSAFPAPSQARPRAESERLTERLRRVIAAFDVTAIDVVAGSPCGTHIEPSLAATLSRRDALAIARLFEQAALFWFDGESMWIDWTDGRPSTALPVADPTFRVRGARAELDESGAH